ncbi:alpha/beta hydrolase [Streptomyces europaeiscabiei]|uniref:alpha/beta hydrolase n=2 Tax=Streptomyces europaeiscabiei TaxID=146819 RepID=UPI0029A53A2A|nr:alpha/beta hydrolase [Streptomyces europaeiscabiei]MDX2530519.1 alpha/beta hydrolase [Streptomyces europaeiscabiei]MDX3783354.1 alpha/beta hydrolase [Streptomyces europaeiscabiei]
MISMTIRTRRALVLALAVSATATALTAVTGPAAATATPSSPTLTWRPCASPAGPAGQECAELPVPLDHRDPDGPQLTLAVSRLRSEDSEARRGTLLVIPGGPGGSGVKRLTQQGNALRRELGDAYDIVSLDPRGTGGSTRASCGLPADDRHLVTLRSWPATDGDITENVARSRRTAKACATNGGAVLRSLSTANEVRDIDRFRQALGEERLSAYGVSYGTYVGAVYAQKYPERTDRWVLDSNDDPNPRLVARGWLANMARGAEERFPDFAAWAADPAQETKGLRLAERPDDVRPLFLSLAAELDRAPRTTTTEGVPLTGNRLRQSMQNALYDDDSFDELALLMRQAMDPKATPVLTPDVAGPMSDAEAAAVMAVVCNDVRWPASVGAHERAVADSRVRYPLTAGMPVNITPCSFWKNGQAEKPTRITDDGPSNILMIQHRRDPATPYSGALNLRAALGDRARLVTLESGGHGAYLGTGNACGDRTVTNFLLTGQRPERDTTCPDA